MSMSPNCGVDKRARETKTAYSILNQLETNKADLLDARPTAVSYKLFFVTRLEQDDMLIN